MLATPCGIDSGVICYQATHCIYRTAPEFVLPNTLHCANLSYTCSMRCPSFFARPFAWHESRILHQNARVTASVYQKTETLADCPRLLLGAMPNRTAELCFRACCHTVHV